MSKIEWTDETWNPIAGCNDVSEGCRNCYARTMAKRLEAMGQEKYAGLTVLQGSKTVWTGKISFDEDALLKPLKRKKPTRYFVNSMSDLFHPNVNKFFRWRVFAVMALSPRHTFQILTKRPEQMLEFATNPLWSVMICEEISAMERSGLVTLDEYMAARARLEAGPLPNVQLGVSVEDQPTADERVPLLIDTPAAIKFVSYEPALGPVNFAKLDCFKAPAWPTSLAGEPQTYLDSLRGSGLRPSQFGVSIETYIDSRLDWVICGGESGHGARPMHPEWARSVRDQCQAAGVAFFFKQWGEWKHVPLVEDTRTLNCRVEYFHHLDASFACMGKKAAGRLLDGREWNGMPA